MSALLRTARLLAIVVWVGGLCFFAFVVAPVAFGVLASRHEAGMVVAGTLSVLNWIGIACGVIFVAATFPLYRKAPAGRPRSLPAAQVICVLLMLLATVYVARVIVPQMERDRIAAGGDVDAAAADNPARVDFERMHPLSEKVEGAVVLLGLGVVVAMGLESGTSVS